MLTTEKVVRALASGGILSGEKLSNMLGISRAAVWKGVKSARSLGLDVVAIRGTGYSLRAPLELLQPDAIRSHFTAREVDYLADLEVCFRLESTNTRVLSTARNGWKKGLVTLAECQTGGRGRRGRRWNSPLGGNIYASVSWTYDGLTQALGGLSLAIASEIVAQLEQMGVNDLWIKWPNDIVCKNAKLGGVLVEIVGESAGTCLVVCGFGLNVDMGDSGRAIDQAWADLRKVSKSRVSRNHLAGRLCGSVLQTMAEYPVRGFGAYKQAWSEHDVLRDREIVIHSGENMCHGVAKGVGEDGALIVEVAGELRRFYGGDVSVRPINTGV